MNKIYCILFFFSVILSAQKQKNQIYLNADDVIPDEEEDWEVVDEEEFDEFDVNKDGVVDGNETIFQQEVERIRNIAGLSAWRKNKMIRELKEKLFNNK